MFLLDTNVISELMKEHPEKKVLRWVEEQADQKNPIHVSALAKAEIESGIYYMANGKKKRALTENAETFFKARKEQCYAFNAQTAVHYAKIWAENRKMGRNIGEMDTMIAAVAVQHKLTLVTRNVKHFAGIKNLKIINPWDSKKQSK